MVGQVHKKYARGVRRLVTEPHGAGNGAGVDARIAHALLLGIVIFLASALALYIVGTPKVYEQGRAEGIAQAQTVIDHANAKTAAAEVAMSDALLMQDASRMAIRLAKQTLATCGELGE